MVVVMGAAASEQQIQAVLAYLARHRLSVRVSRGVERTIIVVLDEAPPGLVEKLSTQAGVERVVPIARPYKLASREYQPRDTLVRIGDVEVGGGSVSLIAGLARQAGLEALQATAEAAGAAGAHLLRLPAFTEEAAPYDPSGGPPAVADRLSRARRAGLPVVAEVRSVEDVDACALLAEAFWVGRHDMHNAALLRRCVAARRPLILERSPAATIEDWLMGTEHILAQGHAQVVLCEAGIRSFDRLTLDLNGVSLVRRLSHLPVVVEPGRAEAGPELLEPLALASAAAGAHGVAVEVLPRRAAPLPAGEPALSIPGLRRLARRLTRLTRAQARL